MILDNRGTGRGVALMLCRKRQQMKPQIHRRKQRKIIIINRGVNIKRSVNTYLLPMCPLKAGALLPDPLLCPLETTPGLCPFYCPLHFISSLHTALFSSVLFLRPISGIVPNAFSTTSVFHAALGAAAEAVAQTVLGPNSVWSHMSAHCRGNRGCLQFCLFLTVTEITGVNILLGSPGTGVCISWETLVFGRRPRTVKEDTRGQRQQGLG